MTEFNFWTTQKNLLIPAIVYKFDAIQVKEHLTTLAQFAKKARGRNSNASWYTIHNEHGGVSQMAILTATDKYTQTKFESKRQEESLVFVWTHIKSTLGMPKNWDMVSASIVCTPKRSPCQDLHMDDRPNIGVDATTVPLNDGFTHTEFLVYKTQQPPTNWNRHAEQHGLVSFGKLNTSKFLVFDTTHIHRGPANPSKSRDRFVLFINWKRCKDNTVVGSNVVFQEHHDQFLADQQMP
jgi:hypothetical protein